MMEKRIIQALILLTLTGCVSVDVPPYIQDKNPYKQKFYSGFNDVLKATSHTIEEMGWQIEKETDPSLYERSSDSGQEAGKQILLFTNVRQTALFLGSRYSRINILLRTAAENTTEIEIRYLFVDSTFFKNFYHYQRDSFVKKIFERIEQLLK